MNDTKTQKSLNGVTIMDNKKVYRNIMDNCSQYIVKANGNKAWLFKNWVLIEWYFCDHTNPFESWKFPTPAAGRRQALDHFLEIQNNNEDY